MASAGLGEEGDRTPNGQHLSGPLTGIEGRRVSSEVAGGGLVWVSS